MACGIAPADVAAPADADLAGLSGANWFKFLDIASLLLLEQTALGFVGGVKRISFDDYSKEYYEPADLAKIIESRRQAILIRWGYGGATITGGNIDLGFAQTDRCLLDVPWP
jgi:hypothetical protein